MLALRSDSAVFFFDETGDPDLSDPNHRAFGWGGCAMPAAAYGETATAWAAIKVKHFSHVGSRALHAAEIELPRDQPGVEAIGAFFRARSFPVLGAFFEATASFDPTYDRTATTAWILGHQIERVLSTAPPTRHVALVFEASERDDVIVEGVFVPVVQELQAKGYDVELGSMLKATSEPGLEIADFVAQAAGRHVRSRAKGERVGQDFQAVFRSTTARSFFTDVRDVVMKMSVMEAARRVRYALEIASPTSPAIALREFPHGACSDAAVLLARYLVDSGTRPLDAVRIRRGVRSDSRGFRSHAWIEIDRRALDITADQFGEGAPRVWAPANEDWHGAFGPEPPEVPDIHFGCCLPAYTRALEDAYQEVRTLANDPRSWPGFHPHLFR